MTMQEQVTRVALITGAGGRGGIGRAIARAFASEGIALALSDVRREFDTLPLDEVTANWCGIDSVAQEAREAGVEAEPFYCDLNDAGAIDAMVEGVLARFGRIDILVNNARALMGKEQAPVTELSREVWASFLSINATAPFVLVQTCARHMVERGGGGRIISTGSDMSKRGRAMGAAYAASKFALLGLTQCAAMDLAPHGITVNAVCPGPVRTNRFSYSEQAEAVSAGLALDIVRERSWDEKGASIPFGRPAEPDEVAAMIAFLASDKAGFITGQAYNVNGGMFFH
jgi:meso-butanediol dehydrogenase/(S,S)-butanediol dehydrogenase/diacetyl reductase